MGRKLGFAIILSLVAVASFAIVGDRLARSQATHVDFVQPPTVYATTTVSPAPEPANRR